MELCQKHLLRKENELLAEKMMKICPHSNFEDGLYASNPPKKRCLDCGEFITVRINSEGEGGE